MQAVVLVGGEGTRLRPLTYSLPKPMAPLLGRPFIGWIIERLRLAGVEDIILSCCYMPEKIEAHFGDGRAAGVRLRYVFEEQPLGTAGAIRNAIEHIEGMVYACNGDILTGLDLVHLRDWHHQHSAVATIHTRPVDDPSHFGVVETDADGRVRRFVEKPKPGETDAHDINAGTYILEPKAIEVIPTGRPVSIERETFPQLIAQTHEVFALSTRDYWIDVGRPDSYIQAHIDMLHGTFARPLGEEVAAGVWCADGREQVDGVTVRPPIFLGPGAKVASRAAIGPYTAVYDDCVIGADADVANSIVWPGAVIGKRAYVHGAILGLNVRVLDGQGVSPGTILGDGAPAAQSRNIDGLFDRS